MKMRRKEKIILLVALASVIGLGIWLLYAWIYLWPEKAVEREFARIRAQGEPVTLEEAAPPEIPDAENAALVYEKVFRVYYDPGEEEETKLNDIAVKNPANWTEEETAAIREYLKENEDCLPLIFEAASFEKCRFPLDYSQGYGILLGHLSKMRAQARLLARDALYKSKEGRIDDALESSWAGLRIGKALLDEPILVSQLVRYRSNSITLFALQKILTENEASPEVLKRLLEELDIEEGRAAFARSLQSERCFQIDRFEAVTKDPALLFQRRWGGAPPQPPVGGKGYGIILGLARPLIRRDEIFSLSIMRRWVGLSKLAYHQAKADLDKLEQELDKPPKYCIFWAMLLPALSGSHLVEARNEATIGLAQLALALKIYKAEEGKYPDALAELVPHILPELPKDPFTGKDFVYKKEAEGFLVYSLGENAIDEGGLEPNDIPWRCKR